MLYKFDLNLQQRAALRIAIWFWENKEVKDKAAKSFRSCKFANYKPREKWSEFIKSVVDKWDQDLLPRHLEAELIHIVKMLGKAIFDWYLYIDLQYTEEEAINCLDGIHWTTYGTVNEVQTFKSSLLNNPNIGITAIYTFACRHAIDDHINDLWDKIPHNIQTDYYKDIYTCFDQHIIAYWKHCKDNHLPMLMRYFQAAANDFDREDMQVFNLIYEESRSTEENMLRLSVHQGYFNAMKFFWGKLTEVERGKNVLQCALITVLCYFRKYEEIPTRDYQRSQYSEICIFLMNQMSISHKRAFYNTELESDDSGFLPIQAGKKTDVTDKILKMFLPTWPWERHFIPVLQDMIQHQDNNSKMPCMFLENITDQLSKDHLLGYSLETNKYRYLLREVWLIIPAHIKQKMVHYDKRFFINDLITLRDLDSLDLLFNDPDIADVRDKFINFGLSSFNDLIWYSNFDQLNEVLEVISRSAEELKLIKRKIVDFYVCEYIIYKDDYEFTDDLLDWGFDTDEEKNKCKNHFKTDIFLIKQICKIWENSDKNINSAMDKCYRFLHWFLESETEIALFKRGIIATVDRDRSTMNCLVQLRRDVILDDFISWCMLDDEQFQQVQRIKQEIARLNVRQD